MDNVNVIYRIPCNNCPKAYIGETKRALRIRMSEHEADIRNSRIKKVVPAHCHHNEHSMNFNKVKIMDFEPHWFKRRVSEMINIQCEKSRLSKNEDTKTLHKSYINIIDKLTHL